MVKILAVVLLALLWTAPAFGNSVQYNAVTDFSTTSNPNGQWSYLMNGSLFTARPCPIAAGIECWWNGGSVPDSPTISKNVTNNPIRENGTVVLPPGELNMDPETISVVARWTAPSEGTWFVSGYFSGIDTNEGRHPASVILDSSTTLFSTSIDRFGEKSLFSFAISLNPGDTVDFEVDPGNAGFFIGTGFNATISNEPITTPEPASLSLLLLGVAGLAARRRWAKRRLAATPA